MKIYKILILFIFTLPGLNLSAQAFERRITHNYAEQGNINPIQFNSGDFVVGSIFPYQDSINDFSETILYLLDHNGMYKDSSYLPIGLHSLTIKNNSVVGVGSYFNNTDSTLQQILVKFLPNSLDTQLTKRLSKSDSLKYSGYINYVNYCSCFTEVGINYDTVFNSTLYVRQFDSNLVVLNYKEFSSPYSPQRGFPLVYSFLERTDADGIILIGSNLDSFNIIYDQFPAVLTFLDVSLNRDSLKQPIQLTSSIIIGGGVNAYLSIANAVSLANSTYLFAGTGISKGNFVSGEGDIGLIKMDSMFNYISSLYYGLLDTLDYTGFNLMDKKHDNIYVLGTSNFSVFSSDWFLNLTRIDYRGNILWNKIYNEGTRLEARGILATSDGGALIIANEVDFNKPSQPALGIPDVDIYILKVDSNGNQTSVGLAEGNIIPRNNFLFYPNPVEDQLTIRKVNQFGNYQLILFDSFGKQVLEYNWVNDQAQLNLSHLKPGMYVYLLVDDEGRSAGGKIIKN
jgi:hypothetical protein